MDRPTFRRAASSVIATKTIVLISGGNTGIGYEIVKKLALEHPNYHILMGCRNTSKGEAAAASMGAPSNVNPIQLDITSDESIDNAYKTIEQHFGKLDILINNAGTAGRDLPAGKSLREKFEHCYSVNAISAAVLTDKMTPLLSLSPLPKVIFITSRLGSIDCVLHDAEIQEGVQAVPFYNSSKTAMNYMCAFYARKYPKWKVNACCPGLNATGLSGAEASEETDPRKGAINAVRLVLEGPEGETGTYSEKEGKIPW